MRLLFLLFLSLCLGDEVGKSPKNGCVKLGNWLGCQTGICCYADDTTGLDVGCFTNGYTTPWCHQVDLPDSPEKINPQFFFYTQEEPDGQDIDYRALKESIEALRLDTHRQLFVLIHGFGGDWPKTYMDPQRDALLELGHNVIKVRWTDGSAGPDYFKATANTRVIGVVIARLSNNPGDENDDENTLEMLESLNSSRDYDLGNVTLVGFSLGAHVAGFAGAALPPNQLRRIIGTLPLGMLESLTSSRDYDLGNVTLVGFSLGAHVAGFAGAALPPNQLRRIIGTLPLGMLESLTSSRDYDLGNVTLVGFSLGAHVAGFAGAALPPNQLRRIIGTLPLGMLESLTSSRDYGLGNVTLVGFSLGAHVAGFAGAALPPNQLRRIIGTLPLGMLESLTSSRDYDLGNVKLVGFSLGAPSRGSQGPPSRPTNSAASSVPFPWGC